MKRFMSILLALIIIMAFIPLEGLAAGTNNGENNGNTNGNIEKEEIFNPNLIIASPNTYTAEAGETIDIRVSLQNTSYDHADDVTANLSGDDTGTVYASGSSYDSIRSIRGGSSADLSYQVRVSDQAEGGLYRLNLNVTYYDWNKEKYTLDHSINVRVPASTSSPKVLIERVDILPYDIVTPGKEIVVGFYVKNTGDDIAKDVKLSIDGLSSESFTLAKGVNYKSLPYIESKKTAYMYFELKSLKTIKADSYELTLNLSYKDGKNQLIEDQSNFFITTKAGEKEAPSNLIIENLKFPTGSISRSTAVNINFSLKNKGRIDAKNIIIRANSLDTSGLVPKSVSILKIDTMEPGEVKDINFEFLTTNSAQTTNYPIEITIDYEDTQSPEGERYTINQFVGIFSQAPIEKEPTPPGETVNKYVPKLIIDDYSFNPSMVKAGENFQMRLSFFNTNQSKSVRNIKIYLTSEVGSNPAAGESSGSVFTPVDSSNTFFIDSIPAKKTVEKNITMFTIPDALAKTHEITANIEYEDNAGNEYKVEELIGVPVVQQSRLEVGEVGVQGEGFIGEPTPVSVEFYNTGKVTLYNLMVKLEGDFDTENPQHYVGNFESGKSDYFDSTLIAFEPGLTQGTILFTYEDSTGEMQEFRKTFELNVMDMPPMDEYDPDMDFMPEEENGSIFKSPWFWIPVIIVLIIAGVLFGRHRKKKRDKELTLDE